MDLRKKLEFEKTEIVSSHDYHTEKGLKTVLVMKSKLTAETAAILGCADVYTSGGVPREWFDTVNLPLQVTDAVVSLPCPTEPDTPDDIAPETIYKFKVTRGDEGALEVAYRVHLLDSPFDPRVFQQAMAGKAFALTIKPRQGDLFEGEPAGIPAEATGGRVNPVPALASKRDAVDGGFTARRRHRPNGADVGVQVEG